MILGLPAGTAGEIVVAASLVTVIVAKIVMVKQINRVVPPNEQFDQFRFWKESSRVWTAHGLLFPEKTVPRTAIKVAAVLFVVGFLGFVLED